MTADHDDLPEPPFGYRFCIDADCPCCGYPERWFDGEKFGCSRCTYVSQERDQ